MMKHFIKNMSREEKQRLMIQFMDSLSEEEKTDMMKLMLPIMMKSMTPEMMTEITKNMSPETRQECQKTITNCLKTIKETK
jgi:ABC-type transporter MlaC component